MIDIQFNKAVDYRGVKEQKTLMVKLALLGCRSQVASLQVEEGEENTG